jgi:transcriptional antiterminator RfaH
MCASRWYVAETQSQSEVKAERELSRQHFRVLLPWISSPRPDDQHHLTLRFPGYILVAFDIAEDPWRSVNGTRGVKRLLTGETPVPLPVGVAESILYFESMHANVHQVDIDIGDAVRINDGPFEGHHGELIAWSAARTRCKILLDLLSRRIPIYVPRVSVVNAARP